MTIIQPILFKTTVSWAVVFLVRFLEKLVEYFFAGGTFGGIPKYVTTHFTWPGTVNIEDRFHKLQSESIFKQ